MYGVPHVVSTESLNLDMHAHLVYAVGGAKAAALSCNMPGCILPDRNTMPFFTRCA